LATIQDLLVRGKRNEAVEEAVRCGHFALALLVAGMCSRETYRQVGRQFVEHSLPTGSPLHTAAMLFCDPQESSSAASSLFDSRDTSQILRTWKSHLASIISNRGPGWETIVLSLADRLAKAGDHDAAHFCYMVCGTPIANPFRQECRWTLVGCKVGPVDIFLSTGTSIAAYARTEAHEWAKRRGNASAAFSSLQAFKVVYARLLADCGFEKAALRYIRSIIDCMAADSFEITASMQSSFPFGLAAFLSDRAGLLRALVELEERLERNCNVESSQYETKVPVPVEADVDISFLTAQSQLPDAASKIDTQLSWNTGVQSQESGNEAFVSIEPQQSGASGVAPPHQYQPAAHDSGDVAPAHNTIPVSLFEASPVIQTTPGKGQASFMSPSQPHPAFQTPVSGQPRMMMVQAKEASQGPPPPVSLSTPHVQSGEQLKGDKQHLSEANVFHPVTPPSLHSQPPHSEGPAQQQEAVSQLPPLQDHPSITRTSAAVPKLTKIAQPPVSAPPNMQKQSNAETPTSSASKSGVLSGLRTWMTKKMNPDATQADIGEAMAARFDEKLGRWIFPGDDPNEVIPSLAPPPKIPLGTPAPAPAPAAASNDPLAAMMAPPQRGPRSGSRTNPAMQGMRPPGSSPPTTAPPQFAVFTPSPSAKKASEDEK
jgi:Sec23-binding domain of Sec16